MERPFRLIPTRLKKTIKEEASQVAFKEVTTMVKGWGHATIAMIDFTLLPNVLMRREKIMVGSSFSRARPSQHQRSNL
jgi:hypothetical protein